MTTTARVAVRAGPPRFAEAATLVQRLSVVLEAGLSPLSAWTHLVADLPPGAIARTVIDGVDSAHQLGERLHIAARECPAAERSAWAALAAAWNVAEQSGSPLAPTLSRLAEVLRDLAQSARDVEVALAGPVATSRVVLALPGVGVAMGLLLGFDLVGAFATVPGLVCLGLGAALILLGVRWNRSLLRRARVLDATPGLALELLAVAMGGGGAPDRARRLVDAALADAGLSATGDDADAVMQFARKAGVPLGALLIAEADELRRAARASAARRAVELETRLLLPLGLCILPAFVVLGVAPVAIAIMRSALIAF